MILEDYKKQLKNIPKFVNSLKRKKDLYAVAHFDLPRSTQAMKLDQPKTITKMLTHNQYCRKIVEKNRGTVIKELGDAVLATFQNAPLACECALKVIHNFKKYGNGIHTKVTITAGTIEKISINNKPDVYGLPVNLCNRMAKYAKIDSILIEESRFKEIKYWLPNNKKIKFCKPKEEQLLDFGYVNLRKITLL